MKEISWWFETTWKSLTSSLYAEKAPYVITLFIAAFCWIGMRTSDRLINNPFIEFQISNAKNGALQPDGVPRVSVRLRNITGGQIFGCFQLLVVSVDSSKLGASPDDQLMIYSGSVGSVVTVLSASESSWGWKIENFAPSADFSLVMPQTGKSLPKLLSRPCDPPELMDSKATNADMSKQRFPTLRERSLTTRYVEYELFVLWTGLLLWLAVLIVLNGLRSRAAASQTSYSRHQLSRSRKP